MRISQFQYIKNRIQFDLKIKRCDLQFSLCISSCRNSRQNSRLRSESCRLANILVRTVREKITIRLYSRCQKREREFLYSSRVLRSRFEFSAVSPPLLCLFITTVSEAINLFHSVSSSSRAASAASRLSPLPPLNSPRPT